MNNLLFMALALVAMATPAFAQSKACANPSNTNDVLDCFEAYHPDIKKTEFDSGLIEGFRRSANQYPNPVLSLQTTKGKNLGDVLGEDTVALSQQIEIGGKRSARAKLGEAQAAAVKANSMSVRAQVRMNALLNLIKYRQLLAEIAVLDEALTAYEKVQRQFASRPRLSPDQQVTFSLFKLSLGDYRHKRANLQAERLKAENFLRLIPELNVQAALRLVPHRLEKWPRFDSKSNDLNNAPIVREAEAVFKQAEANAELEKANAIPDPTVSLIGARTVEGFAEYNQIGVGVSVPLPFWNTNGGARRQTAALRDKAEIDYRRTSAQLSLDRINLINSYNGFVQSLEQAPSAKDIDIKHRNTEALFYRGVVSGVLVIEAHRQILDFTQSQNELELETVQALLNLYLIDGRLQDFKYE